jgi:predicted dehydrogenase
LEELLDRGLDAVTLALPPDQNVRALHLAIARGIPVFTEKPVTTDAPAALRLAEAAAGLTTVVDFEFAELHTFRAARELTAAGEVGAIRHVAVNWMVESYAARKGLWSWKVDPDRGGGVLSLLGSHLLYLAEWFTGPIEHIWAAGATIGRPEESPDKKRAPDTFQIGLRHASGITTSVNLSNAAPGVYEHRWDFIGDRGTARLINIGRDYMSGFRLLLLDCDGREAEIIRGPSSGGDGRLAPVSVLMERFVEAIREKRSTQPDLRAGARVQQLMWGVNCAAEAPPRFSVGGER